MHFALQLAHWTANFEFYITTIFAMPEIYDILFWALVSFYITNGVIGTSWLNNEWIVWSIVPFLMLAFTVLVIVLAYKIWRSKHEVKHHRFSWNQILSGVFPVLISMIVFVSWILHGPNKDYVNARLLRLVIFIMGTVFSNITCRLIILQMSHNFINSIYCLNPVLISAVIGFGVDMVAGHFFDANAMVKKMLVFLREI